LSSTTAAKVCSDDRAVQQVCHAELKPQRIRAGRTCVQERLSVDEQDRLQRLVSAVVDYGGDIQVWAGKVLAGRVPAGPGLFGQLLVRVHRLLGFSAGQRIQSQRRHRRFWFRACQLDQQLLIANSRANQALAPRGAAVGYDSESIKAAPPIRRGCFCVIHRQQPRCQQGPSDAHAIAPAVLLFES
jgi:hypothetical protein